MITYHYHIKKPKRYYLHWRQIDELWYYWNMYIHASEFYLPLSMFNINYDLQDFVDWMKQYDMFIIKSRRTGNKRIFYYDSPKYLAFKLSHTVPKFAF